MITDKSEQLFSYKLSAFSLNLPGANIRALAERVLAANLISLGLWQFARARGTGLKANSQKLRAEFSKILRTISHN